MLGSKDDVVPPLARLMRVDERSGGFEEINFTDHMILAQLMQFPTSLLPEGHHALDHTLVNPVDGVRRPGSWLQSLWSVLPIAIPPIVECPSRYLGCRADIAYRHSLPPSSHAPES